MGDKIIRISNIKIRDVTIYKFMPFGLYGREPEAYKITSWYKLS